MKTLRKLTLSKEPRIVVAQLVKRLADTFGDAAALRAGVQPTIDMQ